MQTGRESLAHFHCLIGGMLFPREWAARAYATSKLTWSLKCFSHQTDSIGT